MPIQTKEHGSSSVPDRRLRIGGSIAAILFAVCLSAPAHASSAPANALRAPADAKVSDGHEAVSLSAARGAPVISSVSADVIAKTWADIKWKLDVPATG